MTKEFDQKAINAIRYIGLKAIQEAKGGHVGMTISAAPITYTLYTKFININPSDGKWINRDRFVLSAGHGSMSLYPIFYFAGLMDEKDLKSFKTEDSKTPGHPEVEKRKDNFIDASTGPLGQGFAMGVGLALAQKIAASKTQAFPEMFTNYTYIVCGDGDLQEGISYEAMAIAGKYNLDKLIVLHDSNKYQLDSAVADVSVENLELRFNSNNWFYQKCSNNPEAIEQAILKAQQAGKPSFIEVDTVIAEGLKTQASYKGHHGVVSDEDLANWQQHFGTNFDDWNIDQEILDYFKVNVAKRGQNNYKAWMKKMKEYQVQNPTEFAKIQAAINGNIDYQAIFDSIKFDESNQNQAGRTYLKMFLATLENQSPFAVATCADLASSTQIVIGSQLATEGGHNLPIGIREFAMGAIMNGLTLYGPFRPIGGTFLVFADYIKSAIRVGALMEQPTIYAFTHDSYQVGGDGPTHQPYDQLPMLRALDHVKVYRPADEEEIKFAMVQAFQAKHETSILILTRQNIPSLNLKNKTIYKGTSIVKDVKDPEFVIAASGSEVGLALKIAQKIKNIRVVSVSCLTEALKLSAKEKKQIFGAKTALITMEASSDYMWFNLHLDKQKNLHLGAYTFGKSMDGNQLYESKGFNEKFIIEIISKLKK